LPPFFGVKNIIKRHCKQIWCIAKILLENVAYTTRKSQEAKLQPQNGENKKMRKWLRPGGFQVTTWPKEINESHKQGIFLLLYFIFSGLQSNPQASLEVEPYLFGRLSTFPKTICCCGLCFPTSSPSPSPTPTPPPSPSPSSRH